MEQKDELECCKSTCDLPLNATFWDSQYKNNDTGWDLNGVSPPIKQYVDTLSNKAIRILIPGCGNAYEAEYLLQQGFTNVTVIDIAETVVNRLKEKFAGRPIRIMYGDYFEHTEKYDLILEQTFFCALNPSLRQRYVTQCFNLLNEGGRIAGLLFNITFEKQGPPFGGNRQEYMELFGPSFNLLQFDVCTTSVKPRLGNELFIEIERKPAAQCYVNLYKLSGITCSGCCNTVTQSLCKVPGVTAVSINTTYTEVMVVSNQPVTIGQLQKALEFNPTYRLTNA